MITLLDRKSLTEEKEDMWEEKEDMWDWKDCDTTKFTLQTAYRVLKGEYQVEDAAMYEGFGDLRHSPFS